MKRTMPGVVVLTNRAEVLEALNLRSVTNNGM